MTGINTNTGLPEIALAQIIATLKNYAAIERAAIFGSRAMGNYRPNSDIDLVVWGDLSHRDEASLFSELDELPLPYLFDVKTYSHITHAPLRAHIDLVAKEIYRKNAK